MIKDSVAALFEVEAIVLPADVWLEQVNDDAGIQCSTFGGGVCQKENVEGVDAGPDTDGQNSAMKADAIVVAVSDRCVRRQ